VLDELIPENRQALLQRYRRQAPSQERSRSSLRRPHIASYKQDAMKIIFHRIERYLKDVFQTVERHSYRKFIA